MKHLVLMLMIFGACQASSQNVGINSLFPSHLLHVKCTSGTGIGINQESYNGGAQVGFYTSNNAAYVQTHNNIPLRFATNNGATQMVLLTNGNLGVGAVDPTYKFTVHAEGTGIVLKGNTSSIALQTGLNEGVLHTNGVPLRFSTSGGGAQMSLTNGNLGIGTLSPSSKLEVLGSAHIHDVLKVNQSITVNYGKGIVRSVNSTQMKIKRIPLGLTYSSLGDDDTWTTGYLSFGEDFSSVAVYVGNVLTPGTGAWQKLLIVPFEIDTVNDRCRFKVTNTSDISVSFDNDWEIILIGN